MEDVALILVGEHVQVVAPLVRGHVLGELRHGRAVGAGQVDGLLVEICGGPVVRLTGVVAGVGEGTVW